ncbi:hypothetical protein N836_05260 [Leptolyngbya sp. Heron Island J]|uniref:hypothetical protein n=1 Tax=Leptolyngbya sp. Heron Island J TaxID=1385935 RepID=UPI0003B9D45D|nr:hypothetical protein [Leptolyngbya sp. Heron Island J]ESA36972.1 hypothetical protein N836_05260 [Leptolyngbya sp. Heron Island J]
MSYQAYGLLASEISLAFNHDKIVPAVRSQQKYPTPMPTAIVRPFLRDVAKAIRSQKVSAEAFHGTPVRQKIEPH